MDVIGEMFEKLFQIKGVAYALQCAETDQTKCVSEYHNDIHTLLQEYVTAFEIPKGLPPERFCNHKIPLIDPNQAINSMPYHYPFHRKNEKERQVKEMMESGIIRCTSSSFASPVVLVRKSDGSWRLRIDYRALNKNTIKDKFPIPMIDDLLDELHRAKFFS